MIRPPRRSVTRFFIPLIDVLILMFCIFLLMPMVEEGAAGAGGDAKLTAGQAEQMRQEFHRLRDQLAQLEGTRDATELLKQIDELKERLKNPAETRDFYFDPKDGTMLYYNDRGEMSPVSNQDHALKIIQDDEKRATAAGQKLTVKLSRHGAGRRPSRGQEEEYERWFRGRVHVQWVGGKGGATPGGTQP